MLKNLSPVAAWVVVFGFLFVSIAHACSGVAPVNLAVQQSPMNMGGGNDSPCGKERGDICQSVRDSILSLQPSVSAPNNPQQTVTPLMPSVEGPILFVSSPVASVIGVHPVSKLPLTISSIVLRV